MAPVSNKSLIYKSVPEGMIKANVNMALEDKPLELTPPPQGLVVKTLVLGFDPHMRDRMKGPTFESYVPGYVPEEPIAGFSVAQVVKSDNEKFKEGEIISGVLPFAEYAVVPVELIEYKPMASHMIWKVENKYNIDLGNWVGALGLAGQTAWNSFYGLVKPKKGETIWVNAASSTVGEIVVQLAKKEGMRVIGSVSSDEKAEYVKSLGADECFNYTKESCNDALKRLAPEGVDVVYENVGGDHFQAALTNMKWFGRIIVCGMVSEYNKPPSEQFGVTNLAEIFRRRINIQGFVFWDHNIYTDNIDKFWEVMPKWIAEGSVKARATKFEGIESAQDAFLSLFTGKTFGKATVKVAEPST
ncbi:nadp-dependent leukotriene b4 12-hydroxydehydrogenase [Diaporthe amygdali]|uniref:nadp-dependent leukotriene b4 12-hydroxydehydrogenase n=1 Tax=Phomopsis amygdali TaxID=1214568 RepID=UPI0022FE4933|nr:nadp-dependent leukotriene b4 12-hydroxydehydrogenase [Diaporthe amygdali]KAJ0120887.1 nadp-dependent leukotriene b4 12-hydroxydehydrogenase [Diaporthe amygdali]